MVVWYRLWVYTWRVRDTLLVPMLDALGIRHANDNRLET